MANLIGLLITALGLIFIYAGSYNIAIFLVGNVSVLRKYSTATLIFAGIIGILVVAYIGFGTDQQSGIVQYVPILLK